MDFETQVKLAVYRHFARTGEPPELGDVAGPLGCSREDVREAYAACEPIASCCSSPMARPSEWRLRFPGFPPSISSRSAAGPTSPIVPGTRSASQPRSTGTGSFARAAGSRANRSGWRSASLVRAQHLAVSLPGAGSPLVGGSRLHLKRDALLPVGRTGESVVRGARRAAAAARADAPTLGACRGVVRNAAGAGCPAPGSRRDAPDLWPGRASRRVLGPAGGRLRPGDLVACTHGL